MLTFIFSCGAMHYQGEIRDPLKIISLFRLSKMLDKSFQQGSRISIDNRLSTPVEKDELIDMQKIQRSYTFERLAHVGITPYLLERYTITLFFDQNKPRVIDDYKSYTSGKIERSIDPRMFSHQFRQNIKLAGIYIVTGTIVNALLARYLYFPQPHSLNVSLFDFLYNTD